MIIFNIHGTYLFQSIYAAILAQPKVEEHNASKPDLIDNNDEKKRDGDKAAACHTRMRYAATRAYHSLVAYGSLVDLSIADEKYDGRAGVAFLGKARCSRLSDVRHKLWMTIRNNPGLFNDTFPKDVHAAAGIGGGVAIPPPCCLRAGGKTGPWPGGMPMQLPCDMYPEPH